MENINNEQVKNASIGNLKNITINDRQIPVKKLGLIKYTVMMSSIKDLIKSIVDVVRLTNISMVDDGEEIPVAERSKLFADALTSLLNENLIQVIKLIDTCVPAIGYEYLCEEVGLEDVVTILQAVIEVNKIEKVMSDLKNLMRSLPQQ
jgi:hypothetical protein